MIATLQDTGQSEEQVVDDTRRIVVGEGRLCWIIIELQ
jgi:hypothetical protein